MTHHPTNRFSNRVDDYVRYRPSYPPEIIERLKATCGLTPESLVADIGSGTGILTRMFLQNGNRVYGVEPNREMRIAGEDLLSRYDRFISVDATAEDTRLEGDSADLIVAGQAFHWFDREKCRCEFARILKPNGWIALIWNKRLVDPNPFLQGYELLLKQYSSDYEKVDHRNVDDEALSEFFDQGQFKLETFPNVQNFDYAGLEGRCFSSSYTPAPGEPGYAELQSALKDLFTRHNESGQVAFVYETNLYYGKL